LLFNKNKYWSRFFSTAIQVVREQGQTHWFKNLESDCSYNDDRERNISWYNRKLGEEW
jgi:hypothetical protein